MRNNNNKKFNGKAIYQPAGKAGEYAKWACNFYVGCSNGCEYCYLRKGRAANILGGSEPKLKKCFKDEYHALGVFTAELDKNLPELQRHGLFFTFTTDPFLHKTRLLHIVASAHAVIKGVNVMFLTKRGGYGLPFVSEGICFFPQIIKKEYRKMLAFGHTLTGCDELEPNAAPNIQRIGAMRLQHDGGFRVWASIEPVIDFKKSLEMIRLAQYAGCRMFRIGLESGKKYDKKECLEFIAKVVHSVEDNTKIYFKDSLLKTVGFSRENLPDNCVGRDYNMFND
ncbi:MAG: hypothetical protein LBG17_04595 [Bacteroidales bacterium]|jgi:DNA repair photolyase|nr:hypothetical protein [Bacteroidales bacterium]